MKLEEIMVRLEHLARPEDRDGMARFGIEAGKALGVRMPELRKLARALGRDHDLALTLWSQGIREPMILAGLTAEPSRTSGDLMDAWALGFYDWEICDQTCMNLFEKTPLAWDKARAWSLRPEEMVKRAGFVLMARLAVSAKSAPDADFNPYFNDILRESGDGRNNVKKGISWALRQIGKRSLELHSKAVEVARTLKDRPEKSARWIGSDAFRELTGRPVQDRLRARAETRGLPH